MPRPVRSASPAVYWRRKLLVLATVALAGLTVYVVLLSRDGGDGTTAGGPQGGGSGQHSRSEPASTAAPSATPVSCVPAVLAVRAVAGQQRYRTGEQPELEIQVTNTGQRPCTADLSDQQIELTVSNGESRVWSSHDCQVKPGHAYLTLAPTTSVRRSIRWTGLSSQPQCTGSRQRVGVGIYTLNARLGLVDGAPAKFTITS